ncbi:unnamed protein product [Zymoseptoria tritici ST99CH_1E4]|uniref:Uncharacterized protein n=1 Tax=Zymoseptoria tritici ST99CH_1E4 TaxID=1276532 RepID=A0A2H1GNX8_ZYMTR|nr:unnamed protein product [Zymoseptoria tritici ST99CH_1E4]
MRGRRNTALSDSSSSAASTSSNSSPTLPPIRAGLVLNEKEYLTSPPPTPSLPPPVTTATRPRTTTSTKRDMAVKSLFVLFGLLALWRFLFGATFRSLHYAKSHHDMTATFRPAGVVPSEPAAVVLTNPDGISKWTISIPHNSSFPLPDRVYAEMCSQSVQLRRELKKHPHQSTSQSWWRKHSDDAPDPTYLDTFDAEKMGVLPPSERVTNLCEKSLTYVLGPDDASFGTSLLHLWLSYGLAKRDGRAFFLDDTNWAWGKFTAYFLPPTIPSCSRPPPHHIVPCPPTARHIVVSTATFPYLSLGAKPAAAAPPTSKHPHFVRPLSSGPADSALELLRTGYSALFHLAGEDALYASSRIAALQSQSEGGALIGLQVRRGDLHPLEAQYSHDYLPLSRYIAAAEDMCSRTNLDDAAKKTCTLALATDDPALLTQASSVENQMSDLSPGTTLQRAQNRIHLATKAALDASAPVHPLRSPGSAFAKHVPENSGWEGGFYPRLFFSIGASSVKDAVVPQPAMELRQMVGRAYVLDLAVLGQASDGVVCGVGSATCRVLGVMMGGAEGGRWRNVDAGRAEGAWTWDGR